MPYYTDFQLDQADKDLLAKLSDKAGIIDWNNKNIEFVKIKNRIKNLHLGLQNQACCYCRRSLHGEFKMVIDIEHVLPRCAFDELTFTAVNLSVSCKRCNMNVKNSRWDFVKGLSVDAVKRQFGASETYEIIHPNLDSYSGHLRRVAFAVDDGFLHKFLVQKATNKGKRTYEFFKLHELEVDSLDRAQGLDGLDDSPWAERVRELLSG